MYPYSKQKPDQDPRVQQAAPDQGAQEARQAVHDLALEGICVEEALMARLLQSMHDIRLATVAGRPPGLDLTDLSDDDFIELMRAGPAN